MLTESPAAQPIEHEVLHPLEGEYYQVSVPTTLYPLSPLDGREVQTLPTGGYFRFERMLTGPGQTWFEVTVSSGSSDYRMRISPQDLSDQIILDENMQAVEMLPDIDEASSSDGRDSDFYVLTRIADAHYISVELLSLTANKLFTHFPMDGQGAPEFLLNMTLQAAFPPDDTRGVPAQISRVQVGTIFMGEGFDVLDSSETVIVPGDVLRNSFDSIKREYQEPDRLELVMELAEDDRIFDDRITEHIYALAPTAGAATQIDILYTAWSMEVHFEATVKTNRRSYSNDSSHIEITIENPYVHLASEAAAHQIDPGADAIESGVVRSLIEWTILKALAALAALHIAMGRGGQLSSNRLMAFVSVFVVAVLFATVDSVLKAVELFALGGLGGGSFLGPMLVLRGVIAIFVLRSFYQVGVSEFVWSSVVFFSILFAVAMTVATLR